MNVRNSQFNMRADFSFPSLIEPLSCRTQSNTPIVAISSKNQTFLQTKPTKFHLKDWELKCKVKCTFSFLSQASPADRVLAALLMVHNLVTALDDLRNTAIGASHQTQADISKSGSPRAKMHGKHSTGEPWTLSTVRNSTGPGIWAKEGRWWGGKRKWCGLIAHWNVVGGKLICDSVREKDSRCSLGGFGGYAGDGVGNWRALMDVEITTL